MSENLAAKFPEVIKTAVKDAYSRRAGDPQLAARLDDLEIQSRGLRERALAGVQDAANVLKRRGFDIRGLPSQVAGACARKIYRTAPDRSSRFIDRSGLDFAISVLIELQPPKVVQPSEQEPMPLLVVDAHKIVIAKEGRRQNESGDKAYGINSGGIIIDGVGGEADDNKAARVIGYNIAKAYNESTTGEQIRGGDVEGVKKNIINSVRDGARALREAKSSGQLDPNADAVFNLAAIVNGRDGPLLITANLGDVSTFIRNDASGEMTLVSKEHSLVAGLVRAGLVTPEGALTHSQRNVVSRFASLINPDATDKDLEEFIELRVIQLKPGQSVIMLSDGPTDNIHSGHLDQISRKFAAQGDSALAFVHNVVENARTIYRVGKSKLAKPDDVSGFALTPRQPTPASS